MAENLKSPCASCTRVACPEACENKTCREWKQWFLRRWGMIYEFGQKYTQKKEELK